MRELTQVEMDDVSGGNLFEVVAVVVIAIGTLGYTMGADAAKRDNP